jgi:hypothetical protein
VRGSREIGLLDRRPHSRAARSLWLALAVCMSFGCSKKLENLKALELIHDSEQFQTDKFITVDFGRVFGDCEDHVLNNAAVKVLAELEFVTFAGKTAEWGAGCGMVLTQKGQSEAHSVTGSGSINYSGWGIREWRHLNPDVWQIPIAARSLEGVSSIRSSDDNRTATVDFRWRWGTKELGRRLGIDDHISLTGTALFRLSDDAWKLETMDLRE